MLSTVVIKIINKFDGNVNIIHKFKEKINHDIKSISRNPLQMNSDDCNNINGINEHCMESCDDCVTIAESDSLLSQDR